MCLPLAPIIAQVWKKYNQMLQMPKTISSRVFLGTYEHIIAWVLILLFDTLPPP